MTAAHLRAPPISHDQNPVRPGCTGKFRHEERAQASQVALRIGAPWVYPCRHCDGWHVSRRGLSVSEARLSGRKL